MRQAADTGTRAGGPVLGRRLGALAAAVVGLLAVAGTGSPASARECVLLCWTPAPTTTTTAPRPTPTTAPAPLVQLPPATVPPVLAGEEPAGARHLLELANEERARAGLAPMTSRDDVVAVALAHTTTMAAAGDIFHNDAYFGSAMKSRLDAVARGENVAVGGSVQDIHARLMASAGHRANILDRRFTVAGIAVVRDAGGQVYATQNFLQPRNPAAPAPAPAAPATTARPPAVERPRAAAPPAPPAAPATTAPGAPIPEASVEEPPVEVPAETTAPAPEAPDLPVPAAPAAPGRPNGLAVGGGSLLLGVAGVLARLARRQLLGI